MNRSLFANSSILHEKTWILFGLLSLARKRVLHFATHAQSRRIATMRLPKTDCLSLVDAIRVPNDHENNVIRWDPARCWHRIQLLTVVTKKTHTDICIGIRKLAREYHLCESEKTFVDSKTSRSADASDPWIAACLAM